MNSRSQSSLPVAPFVRVGMFVLLVLTAAALRAQKAPDPADAVCPRYSSGSTIAPPPDLYSTSGTLEVTFHFKTTVDSNGLVRYCYITEAGLQAPTLHVNPGDTLLLHFINELNPATTPSSKHAHSAAANTVSSICNATTMTASSTNLHFHGMNVAPVCQQDDVLTTLIQPTQTFDYSLPIPTNEPSGLYWYHPHPHGFSEGQVQGGATGAIIVEGIESVYPQLAELPERTLVMRDQLMTAAQGIGGPDQPMWDFSLNYVPITYPDYVPAVIQTPPATQEFWRVLNSDADLILDLQVVVNGVAQPLQVYARDGVPLPASSGPVSMTTIELGPGARVEFVVTTPHTGDVAQLVTARHDTGPGGENEPPRPIANIVATATAPALAPVAKHKVAVDPLRRIRFASLADTTPTVNRRIVMTEEVDPNDANTVFMIGEYPNVGPYTMSAPVNITTHQGTVEQWTVENWSNEDHIFHIHQIHFQQIAADGVTVSNPAFLDTITVPHTSDDGTIHRVTLLMDFRDPNIIGTFVFHCHILAHEDGGMMAKIKVLPPAVDTSISIALSPNPPTETAPATLTATIKPVKSGAGPFLGAVGFYIDGASTVVTPNSSGVATLSATFSPGTHTVSAQFDGDDIYAPAQSSSLTFTVTPPGFTLSASDVTINAPGASGSATITLANTGGFSGSVNFACALPAALTETTCTLTPPSLVGSGTTTINIQTTGPHSAAAPARSLYPGALLLAAFVFVARFHSKRLSNLISLSLLLGIILSCGGGSTPTPQRTVTDPGTSSGTYTLTVTGTSGAGASQITATTNVKVIVQ